MFSDHSRDYQRAASIKPMALPEGMKSQPLEPLYAIPRITEQDVGLLDLGSGDAPRPDPLSKNTEEAKVKIQKVAGKRWILASASSSQIWPLTQSFLASRNLTLAKTQPSDGVIETNWLTLKKDADNRNRFRILIEPGVHPDTAEVHVLQQSVVKGQEGGAGGWPNDSVDAVQEAALLDDLAISLADGVNNRAASLLGQKVGGEVKATVVVVAGEPVLSLNLTATRAVASLARAVTADGFVSWGRNAEAGVYYLGYKDQAHPPGWFSRWFLFAKTKAKANPRYECNLVLQHLADSPEVQNLFAGLPGVGFAEPLGKTEGYLVRLSPRGQGQVVHIRNARGEKLPQAQAKQLLSVLRRNLI